MNSVILATIIAVVPAQRDNRHIATYAIRDADSVIASMPIDEMFWKYHKPGNDAAKVPDADAKKFEKARRQFDSMIDAIRDAGSFAKPIRMSLIVDKAKHRDDGTIHLDGRFQAYALLVDEYRTEVESELIDAFDDETKTLDADFRARMQVETIPMAEQKRHERSMGNRAAELDRWEDELAVVAGPRKDHLEWVKVNLEIPSALVDAIHVDQLMELKRVLITFKVDEFGLKAPVKELKEPARIGWLHGSVTDIVDYLKR